MRRKTCLLGLLALLVALPACGKARQISGTTSPSPSAGQTTAPAPATVGESGSGTPAAGQTATPATGQYAGSASLDADISSVEKELATLDQDLSGADQSLSQTDEAVPGQ